MINVIICLIIAALAVVAFFSARKHFQGKSGCCASSGNTIEEEKQLTEPVILEKTAAIEGMKCDNCRIHVQNALNRIDGVYAKVNLKKQTASIKYTKEVSDETVENAVKDAGYLLKW